VARSVSIEVRQRTPQRAARCHSRSGTDTSLLTSYLTGILSTQRAVTSPEPPELMTDFWRAAYAAIDQTSM